MVNYVLRPQPNHAALPRPDVIETLDPDLDYELYANNCMSRIAFAGIGLAHVLASADVQLGPLCFVTLVPARCAHPVGDGRPGTCEENTLWRRIGRAANFDVHVLKQMARQALGGIPFIGMVEAALYWRWRPGRQSRHDWVAWHCHLITWGAHAEEVSRVLAPFRARHTSMMEGVAAAHVQAVEDDDLTRQFLYMMKAPQKMTRVEYFKRPWTSPTTGEVKPPGLHSQKDWLQTGHRIRLMDVMGHRKLDELFFGNREGTALYRTIRAEALAPFRDRQRREERARSRR
ncbi:hypothetical protein MPOCJGCO_4938 [Methylobacterium trifolii]|uniref:Uncharacterized protein n=2 Tax=Methylobacterium trifolii TaxID=1003092 RepID=A0ABQ4U7E4_9HYPH|nr:hypothetical protein MPOCJGCO_4938 [Methylobacterium trifolii]